MYFVCRTSIARWIGEERYFFEIRQGLKKKYFQRWMDSSKPRHPTPQASPKEGSKGELGVTVGLSQFC